jgi:hypothetical protein
VRWVNGSKLGIEFIRTTQDEQHRLEQFVRRHPGCGGPSTWSEGIVLMGAARD